jgi:hypothetical protein
MIVPGPQTWRSFTRWQVIIIITIFFDEFSFMRQLSNFRILENSHLEITRSTEIFLIWLLFIFHLNEPSGWWLFFRKLDEILVFNPHGINCEFFLWIINLFIYFFQLHYFIVGLKMRTLIILFILWCWNFNGGFNFFPLPSDLIAYVLSEQSKFLLFLIDDSEMRDGINSAITLLPDLSALYELYRSCGAGRLGI